MKLMFRIDLCPVVGLRQILKNLDSIFILIIIKINKNISLYIRCNSPLSKQLKPRRVLTRTYNLNQPMCRQAKRKREQYCPKFMTMEQKPMDIINLRFIYLCSRKWRTFWSCSTVRIRSLSIQNLWKSHSFIQ